MHPECEPAVRWAWHMFSDLNVVGVGLVELSPARIQIPAPNGLLIVGVALVVAGVLQFLLRKRWAHRVVEIVRQLEWTVFTRIAESSWVRISIVGNVLFVLVGTACVVLAGLSFGWFGRPVMLRWMKWPPAMSEPSESVLALVFGLAAVILAVAGLVRLLTVQRRLAHGEANTSYRRGVVARRNYRALLLPLVIGIVFGIAFTVRGLTGLASG